MPSRKKVAKPTKTESSKNDSFDEELAKQIYSQPNTNYEAPENQGLGTILEVNESEAQSADSSRNPRNRNGKAILPPQLRMMTRTGQHYLYEDKEKFNLRKKQSSKHFKGGKKIKWKGLTPQQEVNLMELIANKSETESSSSCQKTLKKSPDPKSFEHDYLYAMEEVKMGSSRNVFAQNTIQDVRQQRYKNARVVISKTEKELADLARLDDILLWADTEINEIETQIRQEAAVVLNASLASSSSINEAQNYDKAVAAAATSFDSSASQNFETTTPPAKTIKIDRSSSIAKNVKKKDKMAASDACNVMDRIPNNAAEDSINDINEDRSKYFVKSNTTGKSKSLVRSSSKATFLRYDDSDSTTTISDSKTLISDDDSDTPSSSSSSDDNETQVEPNNSKRNDYSKKEVETLYKGVSKYGLDFYTIFYAFKKKFHPCRTPVKLYDKWRHHLQYHSEEEYIKMKYQ